MSEKHEISCSSLLQEIEPLLREYFISDIELSEEKIVMSFQNGQKFAITAKEIAD